MRVLVGALSGALAGFVVGGFLGTAAGLLAGWGAAALVTVILILVVVWPMDAVQTRAHAQREDPGRAVARAISVLGSIASLAAVAVVLLQSAALGRVEGFMLAGIAVVSVVASWALIQVDYMLHIARVYYTEPVGGIDFNQDDEPMYSDFAYFAVSVGVAYAVADTNVGSSQLRRIVISQSLLAYLFGAVILATVINLVSNLG